MSDTGKGLRHIARYVDDGDFSGLFISELGWDNPPDPRPLRYSDAESGLTMTAKPVAAKRGVVAYHCKSFPTRDDIESLDRVVSRRSAERLLIFSSGDEQQWRWPEPRKAGGTRYATHFHRVGAANPALFQRLNAVRFKLEEEETLTVLAVRERIRASFNANEVTTAFYQEFRRTQQELMGEVTGIPSEEEQAWYSSLLLNRLMFIYFMQRKGFLNDDPDYLRTSLERVQGLNGKDAFFEYYRDFLIPLFHEGLGSEDRRYGDAPIAEIIGDVPYINGGIFAQHMLEQAHDISVPDAAFERVFDFFDGYRWHLDERPTGNPEEINPEILGYIFEKYVNQKAQGAYYTQEDVTGYMTGMVVVPVFLDRLADAVGSSPADLLQRDPPRYIAEAIQYASDRPLPEDVAAADIGSTGLLSEPATADMGLPGERWREVLDRRQHHIELVARLDSGEVESVDEMVTLNLDIATLATDWINDLEDPSDVVAAYDILNDLRVVDPTCGSGAFLFAALDVLERLYDAVLARVEKLLASYMEPAEERVAEIWREVAAHPSRDYFVLKTIVLHNLYGVDLMPEATEIARLRLFLALVARLHDRRELEPLPDLDMNIRAGNVLVGSATPEEARRRFEGSLLAIKQLDKVAARAEKNVQVYRDFVEAQRRGSAATIVDDLKEQLKADSASLRDELDVLYSPFDAAGPALREWQSGHRPFHWFVEFPDAMYGGGFDAVVGNPPYVARGKVRSYKYSGFVTDDAPDIFAPCMERAAGIVSPSGRYAMIVPISFQFSDRYSDAREVVARELPSRWVSTYSRNPSALFDAGLGVRSTIVVGAKTSGYLLATTELRRWVRDYRPYLFDTNRYAAVPRRDEGGFWPRLGHRDVARLYASLTADGHTIAEAVKPSGPAIGHKKIALYYLSVFIDTPPAWTKAGERIPQHESAIHFESEAVRDAAFMLLSGRLAFWWWTICGDDFNVPGRIFKSFPIVPWQVASIQEELADLAADLRAEQPRQPSVTLYAGKEIGNYDLTRCRHITDRAEKLILEALGLSDLWPTVLLADARSQKVTGERPGTEREWPFPF